MMKPNTTFMIKAIAMSCLLILTACGGGGGSAAGSIAGPQGLWNGSASTSSTSRSVTGIVLDDGSYWLLYSVPNVSGLVVGFVQGTGTSLNGSFSSSDAMDFNVSAQGVNSATVSATYITKQSFNGSVSYSNSNAPSIFTSSYNPDYAQTPNLTAVAGDYLFGIASVANITDAVPLIISAQGVVAGTGKPSGCQYGGLIKPRTQGNVYDVSLLISGGACATGTNTVVTGIGYFDASSKRLYLAALNKSRTLGMSFTGIKP